MSECSGPNCKHPHHVHPEHIVDDKARYAAIKKLNARRAKFRSKNFRKTQRRNGVPGF